MNNLALHTCILACIVFVGCIGLNNIQEQKETTTELLRLEEKAHELVNQYRVSKNLSPLVTHEVITQQARKHSQAMANKEIPIGHDRFEKRQEMIARILPRSSAAENIACVQGYPDCAHSVVKGWLRSSRHRKNIEGNYTLTGIGVAKDSKGTYYVTQIFWR